MTTPSKSPATLPYKIGFIGAGQMALALAKGFMSSGLLPPSQVMASAPSNRNLLLWEQLDANTSHDNIDVLKECEIIFLAVKPNMFSAVMDDLDEKVKELKVKSEQQTSPDIEDASDLG